MIKFSNYETCYIDSEYICNVGIDVNGRSVFIHPFILELTPTQTDDNAEIGVPYAWYWRLAQASLKQRQNWRFISGGYGIHWEEIDEDISIAGILMGNKNPKSPISNPNKH